MKKNTLSIIMPALDEEKNIKDAITFTLDALDKSSIDGEVIVIDDGSTDSTNKIVKNIIKKNKLVKLIRHEKPLGIGASFFDGIKKSRSDIVTMFPGDNENNAEDALSFFKLMDDVDILIPFIHNIEVRRKGRRIISSIYRFIINMSFGINLNYTNGTVFYRRCILDEIDLKSFNFFYQAELLIKLIRKGYLFAEVPNCLSGRSGGKSKAVALKSLIGIIKNYIKLFFDIHFLRIESKRDYKKLNKRSISYKKNSGGKIV
jgi:dolichol-phosphate mannosyltransferase